MSPIDTQHLRNVALVSHSGAGKTSLVEAMLFACGGISRLGKIEDGTTTSDYEPEETRRQSSIQVSVAPCTWSDNKLNILDTPGYPDFIGEVVSALQAVDAAVILVAAHAGVEVGTQNSWEMCEARNVPRLIYVNKMDRENADFGRSLASIQEAFGSKCVAVQVPVGSQQSFSGVVGLVQPPDDIPPEVASEVESLRERLIEAVAETDDDLGTKYLEEEEISQEELVSALKRGVLSGEIVPVLAGAATKPSGVEELMSAMIEMLPSPDEVPDVQTTKPGGNERVTVKADPSGPLAALVFKTTADPFVGKLSYFRVVSGSIRSDSHVWNANRAQDERIGQVFVPRGKTQDTVDILTAGDIGAVAKLTVTGSGDTLGLKDSPILLDFATFPEPLFTAAISPKGKADLDKMASSLSRMTEEDPTLHLTRALNTGETLLSGIGETHIDIAVEKAKRKFGVELISGLPKVAYQETISVPTKVEYRHKKQSGGHGQYGHVKIELEPRPRGAGFEFGSKVVGGNVPKEYIPAVEKGVTKSLEEGVLAGYPIVDLKVVLYDGSFHPVDSSGMSFEIAGSFALRQGMESGNPVLLEPIMRLQVTVPDAFTGEIIGDLNAKRAHIQGMTPSDGITVIEAQAPQSELLRYSTELRSMTQGRGRFKVEQDHYEQVPQHITPKIVEQSKKQATV